MEAKDIIIGLVAHAQERIDHARKHLDEAEGNLKEIVSGENLEARFKAINAAVLHCDVVKSDMEVLKLKLQS